MLSQREALILTAALNLNRRPRLARVGGDRALGGCSLCRSEINDTTPRSSSVGATWLRLASTAGNNRSSKDENAPSCC